MLISISLKLICFHEIKVGKFPFSASGKAKAAGKSEGFVKVIFDANR